MNNRDVYAKVLMPINESFLDVFDTFMDDKQKIKIRANNVRQYMEGIIDVLLHDIIMDKLKSNEKYEGINWGRKIKIIKQHYDESIADKFQEVFRIGGEGSHFNGQVSSVDLKKIIENAIHIVEDIFVKYFLTEKHKFGKENIFTIFSMLPLHHRVYILERVSEFYINPELVDRLSLAYVKSGKMKDSRELIKKAYNSKVIDEKFYNYQVNKIEVINKNLKKLYLMNKNYKHNPVISTGIVDGNNLVIGLPTSKDIFDTAKAVEIFRDWFVTGKNKYPEFINLFLYLMKTDERKYK